MKAYFFLCWAWRILKCLNRVHQWRDKNREPEKRMKFNWASAFSVSCHILWMKTRHISRHRFIFIYFDYLLQQLNCNKVFFLRKFIFKCLNDFLSFSPAMDLIDIIWKNAGRHSKRSFYNIKKYITTTIMWITV